MSVLPRRTRVRRHVLAALGSGALVAASLTFFGLSTAEAAPGNAGVPSAAQVVYHETFEHNLDAEDSIALRDYTGAAGTTYTGSAYWTEPEMCNGILISYDATDGLGCAPAASVNHLRRMGNVLGQVAGGAAVDSNGNHAVSAYTNAPDSSHPLASGDVEFATENPITLSSGSRFLTFSVDAASLNCYAGGARLSFFLDDGTDELPATNTPINVCTDPRASTYSVGGTGYTAGRFISDSSVLFSGTSLGIVMRNGYGSGAGNDHAYDNIRVLDATPQLDKSFETRRTPWLAGEAADLTFTVTNTSELAQKSGWGFVDDLPTGLVVAGPAATTCADGDITAVEGDDSITIANGTIASGIASCTVTVPVTAAEPGTFTNGPGNVTTTGLEEPGESTVIFEDPDPKLTLVKSADLDDTNENGLADIGESVTFTFEVENSGNVDVDDVSIDDALLEAAGLAVTPATQNIAYGDTESFSADPYVISQDDIDAGGVFNTATASGLYDGDEVLSNEDGTETFGPDRQPELTIVKKAVLDDSNDNDLADKGEKISYSFLVTNTGNVTVRNVTVSDDKVSGLNPKSVAALLPQDSVLFTADRYVVTGDDIENGSVDNTAMAVGETVDGDDVESDPDSVSVETVEPADEAGFLPNAGGPLMGIGVLGLIILGAGATILMRRQSSGSHTA